MKDLEFHVPSRIILGTDSLSRLGGAAEGLGSRALLVADSMLSEGSLPERIGDILERKGVSLLIHEGVPSDAFHDLVEEYVSLAKASQCQIIIGLGGIRTLSIAKTVAALGGGDRRADDLLDGYSSPGKRLNYIEIPSTCRNPFMLRDEVLLLDSRNRHTRVIAVPGLLPQVVVLDPKLSSTLSEKYAFSTLMDSFLFALEGLLSDRSSFLSDCLFLKAAAQLVYALKLAGDPRDREGFREHALQGGFTAALGLSMSSLGAGSSLSFALAGRLGLPKSLMGAMFIPEVLEWGAQAAPDKLARLAPILAEDTRGMDPAAAALKTVDVIRRLLGKTLGDLRLEDIALSRDAAADTAEQVYSFPYLANGPGSLAVEDLLGMVRRTL